MTFLSARLARGRVGDQRHRARARSSRSGSASTTSARGSRSAPRSRLGELQLGAFLVIGFMVHNVTEGLGIAAPATTRPRDARTARGARADRRRAGDPRRLDRRATRRTTCSRRCSSRSPRARRSRSSSRSGATSRGRRAGRARARGGRSAASSRGSPRCGRPGSWSADGRARPARRVAGLPQPRTTAPTPSTRSTTSFRARRASSRRRRSRSRVERRGVRGLWPFLGPAFVAVRRLRRPGQLRDEHGRRRAVRLPAAVGDPHGQPDGDGDPVDEREARDRHGDEPARGLPRAVPAHGRASRSGSRRR